jgi:flagellar protein FliT
VSTPGELLACYGRLASSVTGMVEAAHAGRWQQLPALDAACTTLFDQLHGMEVRPLTPYERARVLALEERIRADQEDLATLVQPEFLRLMERMRELHRAQAEGAARRLPS